MFKFNAVEAAIIKQYNSEGLSAAVVRAKLEYEKYLSKHSRQIDKMDRFYDTMDRRTSSYKEHYERLKKENASYVRKYFFWGNLYSKLLEMKKEH